MKSDFYRVEENITIYALILDDKYVFIGKSKNSALASAYSRHIHGRYAATHRRFGPKPPKRPKLYLLRTQRMTRAVAYKYVLAYICLFNTRHQYVILNQEASVCQASDLAPDTEALYCEIANETVEQLLNRTYFEKPPVMYSSMRAKQQEKKPEKELADERLSIRLTEDEKDSFSKIAKSLNLSQRDTLQYLINKQKEVRFASEEWRADRLIGRTVKQYQSKVRNLEGEVAVLRQQVRAAEAEEITPNMAERIAFIQKGMDLLLAGTRIHKEWFPLKSGSYQKYISTVPEYAQPTYPEADSGFDLVYPDTILFSKSRPVACFVVGIDQNRKRRKYRFYPSRYFVGVNPLNSKYWCALSEWVVGYKKAKDGAADMMFAFPVTGQAFPDTPFFTHPEEKERRASLAELIDKAEAENIF